MSTLERQLEQAYAKVLRANEPTLAAVPIRLTTSQLSQSPSPIEDEEEVQEGIEQLPVPCVLLTARTSGVALSDHRGQPLASEVMLMVEYSDNVAPASENGGADFDARYAACVRPFWYDTLTDESQTPPVVHSLFDALTVAAPAMTVLGMSTGPGDSEQDYAGSVVKRRNGAVFVCAFN